TTLCKVDTLCVPVTITGDGYTVRTSYGTYADGHVCFLADTSGTYTINLIATASCNADTCGLKIPVKVYGPVTVSCRAGDTSVFACSPGGTIAIPVSITGPTTSIVVTPETAHIVDGKIQIPVTGNGDIAVKVVASNPCSTDSCGFMLHVRVNQ